MSTTDTKNQRDDEPCRILHVMLRVADLDRSLAFYTGPLAMRLLRKEAYPEGQFTLAFLGYGDQNREAALELTHNWGHGAYSQGTGFGHIALEVANLESTCMRLRGSGVKIVRPPGPMRYAASHGDATEIIAFIEDPDGYQVELIEVRQTQARICS